MLIKYTLLNKTFPSKCIIVVTKFSSVPGDDGMKKPFYTYKHEYTII